MRDSIFREPWAGVVVACAATVLLTTALTPLRDDLGLLNQGLLFLLLTVLVASVWGRYLGLFTAVITNLALNFFFIEPRYELTVHDEENIVALVVFLVVSVVSGSLLSAARESAARARQGQAETAVALTLSRALSGETEADQALAALCSEVVAAFDAPGAALLTGADGQWTVLAHAGGEGASRAPSPEERAAAERAALEGQVQGLGRTGLRRSRARIVFPTGRRAAYAGREQASALVPLTVGRRVLGVLRLDGPIGQTPFRDEPERLLNAVASEAALALQRMELARAASHAEALREADELKTALLNAVSHDLRTPLASIIANAGSLQQTEVAWSEEERRDFAESIEREAQRLNRLVSNLLDLSRIESGSLRPDKGWYDLGALVEEVIGRLGTRLAGHAVEVSVEPDLPPVSLDYVQIDDVVTNLIENATKYTPEGTKVRVSARRDGGDVIVEVADEGSGIPEEAIDRIFEPFYRGRNVKAKGTGLGLAIARGLVEAHGGRIWAENRRDGGALFGFNLPIGDGVAPPAGPARPQTRRGGG